MPDDTHNTSPPNVVQLPERPVWLDDKTLLAVGNDVFHVPPEEAKKWWDRYHSTYGQRDLAKKR